MEQLIHPMALLVPATTACSFAFALPAATPPNSMVFATGRVTIGSFVRNGSRIDALAVVLCGLLALGCAIAAFDALGPFPDWACKGMHYQCVWLDIPGLVDGRHVAAQACAVVDPDDRICRLRNGTKLTFSLDDLMRYHAT